MGKDRSAQAAGVLRHQTLHSADNIRHLAFINLSIWASIGSTRMGIKGTPPRSLVAHQHTRDLFLLALLSTHPRPQHVMREFRRLVDDLTGLGTDSLDDQSYLALVQRSAAAFDRMIQGVLPESDSGRSPDAGENAR